MKTIILIFAIAIIAVVVSTPARETKTSVKQKSVSKCESLCGSSEHKPVCATDGKNSTITFGNVCTMKKYNCEHGKNLSVKFEKECGDKSPVRLDI